MGPSLFNTYTGITGDEFFTIAYADDSYICIECYPEDVNNALLRLSNAATAHFNWLTSIGMVCNRSKTEFIIFDRHERFQRQGIKDR